MEKTSKQEKCSKTQKNRIVINKYDKELRIYKNELDEYLKEGWEIGVSPSHKKSIGKSHKGQIPWNKGITPSDETRLKQSQVHRGKYPWNKGKSKYDNISNELKNEIIKFYLEGNCLDKCVERFKLKRGFIYSLLVKTNNIRDESEAYKFAERPKDIGKKISKSKMGHPVSQKTRDAVAYRNKHRTKEQIRIQLTKSFITKKLHNTFNKSKQEEELYKTLLKENVNKTIYRQYKDDRYPFYCDFYIVEDDLFIELNAHWTHGGHSFDKNNEDDIKKLNEWKEKSKTSKFYENAIIVWTQRDVEKQRVAKENKLNYKVIY